MLQGILETSPVRLCWSPAKVNLTLRVGGRLPSGFHELETVMYPVSMFDRLGARRGTEGIKLTVHQRLFGSQSNDQVSEVPADEANLVVKIARGFLQHFALTGGVCFYLQKRLPAGGGLGGASSNAAAALQLLNELFETQLSWQALAKFSAAYGSDIAFFLQPGAAICRGRGEIVEPIPAPNVGWIVIVRPPFGLSTPTVFQRLAQHRREADAGRPGPGQPARTGAITEHLRHGRLREVAKAVDNDLQAPALSLRPELSHVQQQVERTHPIGSQMSGSGSCWFALYPHRRRAVWAGHRLRATRVGQVEVARPISHLPTYHKGRG